MPSERYTTFLQVRYDLRYGILRCWPLFLPYILLYALACVYFKRAVEFQLGITPTAMDYMIELFKGMPFFDPGENVPFKLPGPFTVTTLYTFFLVARYPDKELGRLGQQRLVRLKSKGIWWMGKCVWAVASIALVFLLAMAVSCGSALWGGAEGFARQPAVNALLSEVALEKSSGFLFFILLPFLALVAIAMLQGMVAALAGAVAGYCSAVIMVIMAIFTNSSLLIGNFLMPHRFVGVTTRSYSNIHPGLGVPVCLAVGIVCAIVGGRVFKRKDIL